MPKCGGQCGRKVTRRQACKSSRTRSFPQTEFETYTLDLLALERGSVQWVGEGKAGRVWALKQKAELRHVFGDSPTPN